MFDKGGATFVLCRCGRRARRLRSRWRGLAADKSVEAFHPLVEKAKDVAAGAVCSAPSARRQSVGLCWCRVFSNAFEKNLDFVVA
jgi:hypothetical protein